MSQRSQQRLLDTLRAKGIRNEDVLETFAKIPRHEFVEEALRSRAYEDTALPIGYQQTISQPYVVALMTQLLLTGRERLKRVLEIGTGSGFQTAVLSRVSARVFSIERIGALAGRAYQKLGSLGIENVSLRHGDGANGWSAKGPFDGIILTAAPRRVPDTLFSQLSDQGVLVAPEGSNRQQRLLYWIKQDGIALRHQSIDVVFVPLKSGQA
ncbi:MAG TPA: protein-L-isoaspartate(D-aspartate) O-methyltransferase [Gammaproteobacteria bacterium]|nr:MAG: protein-L-isoaspartate O-methyltransferase [Candidatus Thioglobus sp. MED-G23]RPG01740.1 MAG: protein-L-isoaspartate(D-aspartate) O-methyltransferase [Proteobacteria bacterium TMED51]HAU43085.1 protein-L-isoaspartate(D-aspartate) O-methyltransferase [Gammaproteobacteria bacterium]HBP85481.1 protein-L-isoaspartate(D-aspartate) O-methyltransferase [Gammaproteobacteria bacterium]